MYLTLYSTTSSSIFDKYGECQCRAHSNASIVDKKNSSQAVDFVSEPWNDAALVTPGPAVCIQWNNAALRKICRETGQSIFVCTAEDTIKGRSIGMREKYTLQAHRGRKKQTEGATHQKIFPIKSEFLSA